MDNAVSDTAPKILENLVAAGLVTHELIGDPARLAGESVALAALCARIGGAVYRLGAFHYAFRLEDGDVGSALRGTEPSTWGKTLEAALVNELGDDAVWVTAVDLIADTEADLDSHHVMFLKAAGGAIATAVTDVPDLQAVIHAGIAARSAETAALATAEAVAAVTRDAGIGAEAVASALAGLIARIDTLEEGIDGRIERAMRDAETGTEAVSSALARLSARIEALEEGIDARIAAAVASGIPDFPSQLQAAEVAETVAEEMMRRLPERVEPMIGAAVAQAVSESNKNMDPGFERLVGAMELVVGRLTEQAARVSEQAARQDALASGISAVEANLEALTRATSDSAASRDTDHTAAFAAFEERLGLALAEFLAQFADRSASSAAGARVVEIGRSFAPLPTASEAALLQPLPTSGAKEYAGPLARAVQVG